MAGHSKWSNIKRRKGAQDAKRGKIFMKAAKDIYIAAKEGGPDPEMNPALRLAIENAKANNVPNDNIERNIKKATGTLDGVSYDEFTYEGYGPGGSAVMVEVLTDNRNRTASEVRHAFSKNGGNLGENGCVAFMFNRQGYIVIDRSKTDADEDTVMLAAIEAGADEMETSDEVYEIYTEPDQFAGVRDALLAEGFEFEEAEVTLIPTTSSILEEADEAKMEKLIDALENLEDIQDVHHNAEQN